MHKDVLKSNFTDGSISERVLQSTSLRHLRQLSKDDHFQKLASTDPLAMTRHVYSSFLKLLLPVVSSEDQKNISSALKITKFGNPGRWYPMARTMERRIYAHIGPTNSGKTHAAIQKMKSKGSGTYCAPLRLLAMEMYDRLNLDGIACSLVTGETIEYPLKGTCINPRDSPFISCTVEMFSHQKLFDIVIIDEIQMMADSLRGWAFTEAFLGARAPEVHVCGEESIIPVLKKLCIQNKEPLEIVTYKRLSPLHIGNKPVFKRNHMKKGDCFVTFSRNDAFELKNEIEHKTGKKCAIVYGKLPLESRRLQAKLFNSPDSDYDYLVATDAIGMGLNLYFPCK